MAQITGYKGVQFDVYNSNSVNTNCPFATRTTTTILLSVACTILNNELVLSTKICIQIIIHVCMQPRTHVCLFVYYLTFAMCAISIRLAYAFVMTDVALSQFASASMHARVTETYIICIAKKPNTIVVKWTRVM